MFGARFRRPTPNNASLPSCPGTRRLATSRVDAPHRVRAEERLAAKRARRVPYELTETWTDEDLPEDDG